MNRLRSHFDSVREQALSDGGDDAQKVTRLLINRLLHAPSEQLREVAGAQSNSDATRLREMEDLIDRLFGLKNDEDL